MSGVENNMNMFMLHFIEWINSNESTEVKITGSLARICQYFRFKQGFIYQTDGFRFLLLRETFGNDDQVLPARFEVDDIRMDYNLPFYSGNDHVITPGESEILIFFKAKSLFLASIKDTEGKIIGFIGFADDECCQNEFPLLNLLSGMLSKEVIIREYQEKGIRTSKTLENIMNHLGVDIYVNSFENHDMLYANESMAAPYGGLKHFEGKKCWQALYRDKTGECDFCPRKKLIDENGNPTKIYSWDYQRPFDKAWFRVFSSAFNWTDGQMAHVVTSVDITNQKNIEEQLIQAKNKAEDLDRLKSVFLANMSHEIRTPLNAIVGFSTLMVKEEDQEKRRAYAHIVKSSNKLLLQLITNILDFSKIESGILNFEMEPISVNELCGDIVYSYQTEGRKEVPIVFARNSRDYFVHSDKKRLIQVITNLINNAVKFTTKGKIILGCRVVAGNQFEFYVSDSGIGIPEDQIGQVFDRFIKLDRFASGTGLGLSICKSIVEQLNGTIGVESKVDVGSRFWFSIPYQSETEDTSLNVI